uniref:Ionotropic glutamate receptor L-glutamate and glycine-binding domain-containing protein n=1 Tax=Strigamia maritima TaxID=126957 RepID=T1IQG7_STRMM
MALSINQPSNHTIKVGLIHLPPEMKLSGPDDNITLGGYFGEFFEILFAILNISYQYIRIPENQFGSLNKNKTWSGMMNYLVEHVLIKIDIGASLTQTRKRQDYVKFSPILYSSSYRLLYRQLDDPEWSYNFFLKPFQTDVWICVLILSSVVILFAHYYKRRIFFKTGHLRNISNLIHDVFFHFILCWPIILQSGIKKLQSPRKNTEICKFSIPAHMSVNISSSRIIFLCYYVFVLLTIVSYNSHLTAMLTVSTYTIPFQSVDDMILKTNYFPVLVEGRSIEEMFLNAEQEPWKSGWGKILANLPNSMVVNTQKGIDIAYSTKAAFITTLEDLQSIRNNCSLKLAPGSFGKLTDSIAYAANFPYIEIFNTGILRMREVGIINKLARDYYLGETETLCSSTALFKSVVLRTIVGIVLAYLGGLMLSLLVFLVEILLTNKIAVIVM